MKFWVQVLIEEVVGFFLIYLSELINSVQGCIQHLYLGSLSFSFQSEGDVSLSEPYFYFFKWNENTKGFFFF